MVRCVDQGEMDVLTKVFYVDHEVAPPVRGSRK